MRIARIGVFILLLSGVAGGASDFLTEGVDNARTGWVRDEKVFTTANVGSTKLLWKVKLESTPRAMHNLFAPLVAERVTTARGRARARGRRRRLRRSLRHRRRHGPAGLAPPLRQHAGQTGRHERHALPRRPDRGADDGADVAWQVHGLRGVVGWPPAAAEPRGRPGRRAAREVHPRRRQAVRAQPAQRRHLHRHGAGLRRPDQRVLLVRPRHAAARAPSFPPAAACGDGAARPSIPRAGCSSAPATRSSIR